MKTYCPFVILLLLFSTQQTFAQSQIIFSQYIETNSGSTPKGVEIFNVSGEDIVLSASNFIQVFQGVNGGGCSALAGTKITSGTLKANEVWVIGTGDLTGFANTNGTDVSGTQTFGFSFNGDDALQLYLGASLQDAIGICGSDPGSSWSGSSVSTANQNIALKDGVCNGEPSGFTNPSIRFTYVANGSTMTGFGNAPAPCVAPNDDTELNFAQSTYSANEGDGSIDICVSISNPSATTATTVNVVRTDGNAALINNFSSQTLTFPSESSADQCVSIILTDDMVDNGLSTIDFELQNPSGGENASKGTNDESVLEITDNDGPELITVCYDFSEASASTAGSLDGNITFSSHRNSGTATPAIFSGQLRLYQNATKGGSIKIQALNGVTIHDVEINASGTTGPAGYTTDDVFVSNLNASILYNLLDLDAIDEVEFYQRDGNSSNRIYVDNFCVTYSEEVCDTPPSSNATNYSESGVNNNTANLNWTSGNGENRLVVLRSHSPVDFTPQDLSTYSANNNISAAQDLGNDHLAVYSGDGSSVALAQLNPGTAYYYKVFEYNCSSGSELYLSTDVSEGVFITEPENPDNLLDICLSSSSAEISWEVPSVGNFDGYMLVARQGATPGAVNSLNINDLTASSNFSAAPSYGSTDSRILYIGNDLSSSISGLTNNQSYTFRIFTYSHLAEEDYTEWSTGTQITRTAEIEEAIGFGATVSDEAALLAWGSTNALCFDEVQVIVCENNTIPSPDESYTSNEAYGSGSAASGCGFAVYSGTDENITVSNLINGTTYYATIFVRFGNTWSDGVQISFVPTEIQAFAPGDLAIVSVNTQVFGSGSEDELCFVAFREINSDTPLDLTDNGYERISEGLWGDTEGTIRLRRTGTAVSAGQVICLQGAGNNSEDFDVFTCGTLDNANWNITSLNGSTNFDFNENDQIWILSGGNWINPSGIHNATYSGSFLYGWTAIGWEENPGYSSTSGSTLPEGFNCFFTDLNEIAVAQDKVKYTSNLDARSAREWIIQLNDTSNWTGYTNNANYEAERNYRSTCFQFPLTPGLLNNQWMGNKSSNWFDCNNWGFLKVPTEDSDIIIDDEGIAPIVNPSDPFAPLFNEVAQAKSINITNGGSVTLAADAVLELQDSLIIEGANAFTTNVSSLLKFKDGADAILKSDQGLQEIHGLSVENNTQLNILSSFNIIENLNLDLGTSLNVDSISDLQLEASLNVDGVLNIRNNSGLVQGLASPNATGTGTVNIFRSQSKENQGAGVLNHWSAPVSGSSIGAGGTINGTRNWRYRGGENGNSHYVRIFGNMSMQNGVGYTSLGNQEAMFTGSISQMLNGFTPIEVDLDQLEDKVSGHTSDEYYLLGNPFPSAISLYAFLDRNYDTEKEILGTVYVFSQANSFGAYSRSGDNIAINLIGSSDPGLGEQSTRNTTIEDDGDFKLASGQGFFVVKHDDGDAESMVRFTNSMRVDGNNNFKSRKANNKIKGRFWIYVNDGEAYKSTLLGLASDATFKQDLRYDAPKNPSTTNLDIWTEINGKQFEIQGIPPTTKASYRIPLNVHVTKAGFFDLQAYSSAEGMLSPILMLDAQSGMFLDLREKQSFYADKAGLISERFFLFFKGDGSPNDPPSGDDDDKPDGSDDDDDSTDGSDDDDEDDQTVSITQHSTSGAKILKRHGSLLLESGHQAIRFIQIMGVDGKIIQSLNAMPANSVQPIYVDGPQLLILELQFENGKKEVLRFVP